MPTEEQLRAAVLADVRPQPTTAAPPKVVSIADAIRALGKARAFGPADAGFGYATAARIGAGIALNGDALRRAQRLLPDYTDALARLGLTVDVAAAVPAGSRTPPPPPAIGRSKVWLADGSLWLRSPYAAKQIVADHVPSATWSKAQGCYKLPATPMAALSIADTLGRYGIDADDEATALLRAAHTARSAGAKRTVLDLPPIPDSKTDAWNHQRQAFWFARELPGALLDMEMGTGKSKVVVDLIHDSGAMSALIACPERVVGVWPKQFGLHSGGEKHIVDPRRQNRRGEWELLPIAKRVELYEHALHECDCGLPHVLLTNYAASAHEPFKSWSLRQRFDYIAYDEVHRLRSHSGVWSKWAMKMERRADRRLGGTGTLQAQTPLDVFGPARAVEPGVFGASYTAFERRYAVKGGYEGHQILRYQNEDELAARIASITYHAGEEVLDLPEMLPEVRVTGRLSPRARKAYADLEADLFAEVRRELASGQQITDEVSVDNVLVKILRCQQITGGALPLDSGVIEEIDTEKAKLLGDELEDIDPSEPVVVFCRFIHDLNKVQQVAETLKWPYGELSGRRSDALSSDATLAEGVSVAAIQIQAGGTGIDLTRSAFGIYYSVGHSLGDYLQSRKRLQRPGQTRPVRFRHLVMESTIDEDIYAALAERQSVVERIAGLVKLQQARS